MSQDFVKPGTRNIFIKKKWKNKKEEEHEEGESWIAYL